MKLKVKIGELIESIAEYKNHTLTYENELAVDDLGIQVPTPTGLAPITHVIKKRTNGIKITFEDGHVLRCANKHILNLNGEDIFANTLTIGDVIDTFGESGLSIQSIEDDGENDYYDIAIPAPHLYYDAHGIVHHNTIITATLSKLVESYGRSIIIVPNKSLVEQTESDYKNLGLDVGVFYGDRKEYNKTHTICTWQSLSILNKKSKWPDDFKTTPEMFLQEFLEGVVCVIVDETHMAKADQLKELLTGPMANIPIRWGLTGTIPKDDCDAYALYASLGNVVSRLAASDLMDRGVLANCHVHIMQLLDTKDYKTYQDEYKFLVEDQKRLEFLAEFIKETAQTGNTLILVDRITTGKELCKLIPEASFVSGSTKAKDRKDSYTEINEDEGGIMVATYGVAAVGINIPRIFNLVLIEPGKSFVRVIQSIGRGIRKAKDKDFVNIWDITSNCKFSARQLTVRKKYYKEANYPATLTKIDYLNLK